MSFIMSSSGWAVEQKVVDAPLGSAVKRMVLVAPAAIISRIPKECRKSHVAQYPSFES